MTQDRDGRGTIADLHSPAVPASADKLPALRHSLCEWALSAGLPEQRVEDLSLAAYEAMANVVEHAYPGTAGTFDVNASYLQRENCLQVTVTDRGRWQPPPEDPGPLHGRGLPLMRRLADSAEVRPSQGGTMAVLRWVL